MPETVSEEEFRRYVQMQMSGHWNMADVGSVAFLLGMRLETVKAIQDQYENLEKKYQ